jgi:Na+/glutamate symporter
MFYQSDTKISKNPVISPKSQRRLLITRRGFLRSLLALGIWSGLWGRGLAADPSAIKRIEELQKNWRVSLPMA